MKFVLLQAFGLSLIIGTVLPSVQINAPSPYIRYAATAEGNPSAQKNKGANHNVLCGDSEQRPTL